MADQALELVGRESEQTRLTELLTAARNGASRVLILEGEPGAGKSALLRWSLEQAHGFRVVWAQCHQSEVELPYGGLGQLLAPLTDKLSALSQVQVNALSWAGSFAATRPDAERSFQPDHFALGAAMLALLAAAAVTEPVIVVVDDAHWMDHSSVEALAFMSRRMLAEGVVLLLSRRANEGSTLLDTLPAMRIAGLTPDSATELLRRQGAGHIGGQRVEQLVAASGGNPLALLELPRLLDDDELAGLVPTHKPLPIGDALLKAYAARFDSLTDGCRQAAAIVALLSDSNLAAADRALREEQLSVADLTDAEDSGLLDVAPSGVSFRHPLARSAAVYSLPPSWRRRAHSAVGRSLAAAGSVNKRVECAWHLAAAATGPDEQTAAMLENAGENAAAQSAWGAATPAYERAAQLSPDDESRYRRFVLAANVASHAGLIAKARVLLSSADRLEVDDPAHSVMSAQISLRLDLGQGRLRDALTVAATAADEFHSDFPIETGRMLSEAATAAIYRGDQTTARNYMERGISLSQGDATTEIYRLVGRAGVHAVQGEFLAARELESPIVNILSASDPGIARELLRDDPSRVQHMAWLSWQLFQTEELTLAGDVATATLEWAREAGVLTVLPYCLTVRASIALRAADGKVAEASASQSLSLAGDMGLKLEIVNALSLSALVAAHFGSGQSCRTAVDEGLRAAAEIGMDFNVGLLRLAAGVSELGVRNVELAVQELEECRQICQRGALLDFGYWHWPQELVEAYVLVGDVPAAREVLEQLDAQATQTERPILKAWAARCHGLLESNYEPAFAEALGWHGQSGRPFELARTQLAYGQRLRRDKKKAAARAQLEAAFLSFQSMGAMVWSAAVRAELAAAGADLATDHPSNEAAILTPQELQVALAVAAGATNRETAAQLFLSQKTVEYHLSRVFRKLGVGARSELANALAPSRS